jgi:hypothetical protein
MKLASFRKTTFTGFLSFVYDRSNTSISIVIYTCKYTENMIPKGRRKRRKE